MEEEEKPDGFAVRLESSGACESAVNVIRVFTNAATVIQDLIPFVLRFSRHVEVVGVSLFWPLNGQLSRGHRN